MVAGSRTLDETNRPKKEIKALFFSFTLIVFFFFYFDSYLDRVRFVF